PALTERELGAQIGDCRPAVVFVDGARPETVRRATAGLERCALLDVDGRPNEGLPALLAEVSGDPPGLRVDPDGPAIVVYTAGTTGQPKGIQLSHRNVLTNARQVLDRTGVGPDDRLLVVMPIFHVNGLCNQTVLPA